MRAYEYAADGKHNPAPLEYRLATQVYKFGIDAVLGAGPHPKRTLDSMNIAQNVVSAYREREASGDWAKWASDHKGAADLLARVARLMED